jgi:hypothetical protein
MLSIRQALLAGRDEKYGTRSSGRETSEVIVCFTDISAQGLCQCPALGIKKTIMVVFLQWF